MGETEEYMTLMEKLQQYESLGSIERLTKIKNDSEWIPCKLRFPDTNLIEETCGDRQIFLSEPVLAQTKRGEMFVATYKLIKWKSKSYKDYVEWVTYGTGGRRMKVISKVIAWKPAPEKYQE